MTFGLNVLNSSGDIMLDSNLPQMPLLAQGSVSGNNVGNGTDAVTTVSFGMTIASPILFVRPRNLNNFVMIGVISSTQFQLRLQGTVDWRVYDATGTLWATSLNYGISVYNAAESILYNTDKNPPFIRSFQTAMQSSEMPTGITNTIIKTLTVPVTAYDGGLPFILASMLQTAQIVSGPAVFASYALTIRFATATQMELWRYIYQSAGSNLTGAVSFLTGQYPKTLIAIR
jgi:hypothetical protein